MLSSTGKTPATYKHTSIRKPTLINWLIPHLPHLRPVITGIEPMPISQHHKEMLFLALAQIPSGRVISYGELARRAGMPNGARMVGRILSELPQGSGLPWHRVINAQGKLSFPLDSQAYARQKNLLLAEGVEFAGDKIKLSLYGWPG
jgi:methylated-DNA-protein-cysteine methyltransferase related protein